MLICPQEPGRADSLTPVSQGLGRVLVVDDDEVIRQLIAVNLTLEGFEVVTAVDGRECLEKVAEVNPDVITLDVMMPRLDGWVTATQLRRNPETSGIKVVLITARAQEDDRDRGRQIGVDFGHFLQAFAAVHRGHDLEALERQVDRDQLTDDLVIINYQHPA